MGSTQKLYARRAEMCEEGRVKRSGGLFVMEHDSQSLFAHTKRS
jgi:hypothetical protein